ncbi:LuxR C-terminal-related transcriptional regulator [Pseudonocardia xinjiangensis]|uniref:LuxR C-terminal-related transcriptional regulator n=1 Tax=Pseudonocardia xinjiangensis TaxID=75289 RepID=UPI003D94F51F
MRIPAVRITRPALPTGFTSRPRVLQELDRVGPGQLIAVIAPPGHGKTALLVDWLSRPGGPPSAWICLDAVDDAPRLRSALLAAVAALPGLPADSPLRTVGSGGGDLAGLDVVDELAMALDGPGPVIRVVLDDVHALIDPAALRDLARLVRRRPARLRLVLAARVDPPLPLPRMRLEGRLHELRAEDLRFTVDETAALLHASGLDVTAEQVAVLHAETGGWVAGLRLAALALRSRADPERFIAQFSGSERSVADYLTDEVMAGLPVQIRQFLRVTAICAELPAGLAVALSGRPDAERVLDELTRATALVERRAAGTYRIHTLLRTHLITDLERHFPASHHRAHARAARWWLAAAEPEHALRHAERAGEPALLLDVLRAGGVRLVATGRLAAVRQALAVAGPGTRATDPWPALLEALVHHEDNAPAEAAAALERARRLRPSDGGAALAVLRASVELLVTGRTPVDALAARPPWPVPVELDALLRLSRAEAALGQAEADPEDLRERLDGVVALAREHDLPYVEVRALSLLAGLESALGRYREMTAAATGALVAAGQRRCSTVWTAGAAALIAYGCLLAGDPAAARARAEAVPATRALPTPDTELALRMVHGTALGDLGERAAGLAGCRLARAAFGDADGPAPLLAALAVLEHRAALVQSGGDLAGEVAEWLERRVGKVGEVLLMDAWAHLRAGRIEAAGAALEPLAAGSVVVLAAHTPIEVHLLQAEVALRRGEPAGGRAELAAALELGSAMDVARPFALTSGPIRDLLSPGPPPGVDARFAKRIAAALAVIHPDVPAPLSERELAVLSLLPSLLSAGDIADELTVSINTVKSHIRSIYGKLGVSTRRDAVRLAHERHLFP